MNQNILELPSSSFHIGSIWLQNTECLYSFKEIFHLFIYFKETLISVFETVSHSWFIGENKHVIQILRAWRFFICIYLFRKDVLINMTVEMTVYNVKKYL